MKRAVRGVGVDSMLREKVRCEQKSPDRPIGLASMATTIASESVRNDAALGSAAISAAS